MTSESKKALNPEMSESLLACKQQKAKVKASCTRARNKLINLVESEDQPSKKAVRDGIDQVNATVVKVMDAIVSLSSVYSKIGDCENLHKLDEEMNEIEKENADVVSMAQEYLASRSDTNTSSRYRVAGLGRLFGDKMWVDKPQPVEAKVASGHPFGIEKQKMRPTRAPAVSDDQSDDNPVGASHSHTHAIGNDMWKQLKRVAIPVFSGDVTTYESWKSAFMTCVYAAPVTAEYKLLQLRQYLSGDALKAIQALGHSAIAYNVALQRLDRKYGGKRRQVALQIEELTNFRPIREGNSKDLERFADMLDVTVVNIRESDRVEELGNGLMYVTLLKKMTESMVARYQRWVFEMDRQESVETLREWLIQESQFQTIAKEAVHGVRGATKNRDDRSKSSKTFVSNTANVRADVTSKVKRCVVCSQLHSVNDCLTFKSMSVSERWKKAKEFKLCFRCLSSQHLGKDCTQTSLCGISGCKRSHNRLLHTESYYDISSNSDVQKHSGDTNPLKVERSHTSSNISESLIALRTIPVVVSNGHKKIKVNALLDDASTKSYINENVAAELGLNGQPEQIVVNVLNGQTSSFETKPVTFNLQSTDGAVDIEMSAMTTRRVTGDLKVVDWQKYREMYKHLSNLPFPKVSRPQIVDLLIGVDYLELHQSYREIAGHIGEPIARLTPLGWSCVGNIGHTISQHTNYAFSFLSDEGSSEIDHLIQRFWEIDQVDQNPVSMNPDDALILEQTRNSLVFEDGKYQVGIPWNSQVNMLSDNYDMAFKRLQGLEKKLSKSPATAMAYDEVIKQYLEKGYIRLLPKDEPPCDKKWYLPHFPIIKPDRETTKVRIVFDASARFNDLSLNDAIHSGPKLQRDLADVLLRFRKNPVAIVSDIAEMYLQIKMSPCDRPFHRFLWRSMDMSSEPQVYEFNRVVFGVTSSPFLAQFVTQEHATNNRHDNPLASETVIKSTYMDDSMDSVESDSKGIELYTQLVQLWSLAGMHARKWLSNSLQVLDNIPVEDRALEVDISKGHLPSVKTLGLLWVAAKDMFTFKVNFPIERDKITKRIFLRYVAKLFDPIGLIAPFIVTAKILLQELWMAGLDWDESVDQYLRSKIQQWLNDLKNLELVEVPRCLCKDESSTLSLHAFVDASEQALGAAVYAVSSNGWESTSILVSAKSKVAPLKAVTIPRLELMTAVLGLRLALKVAKALCVHEEEIRFWSDSMNVLAWIRNNSRFFKPFVANRVGEIQSLTSPSQWRHIPSKQNPADLISRGVSAKQLEDNALWWSGPPFLTKDEEHWPEQKFHEVSRAQIAKSEVKQSMVDSLSFFASPDTSWKLDPVRFSSWNRLIRINAWVYRFIGNCIASKDTRKSGELEPEELEDTEKRIIQTAQQETYREEYASMLSGKSLPTKSKLVPLNPQLDECGLMRFHGRLENAESLPFEAKFPIILPSKHWVTTLIIKHCHEQGNHVMGTNQTLAILSSRFWIPSARERIRSWEKECSQCRINKAKPTQPIMAPLPKMRVGVSLRAFSEVGVDFAGPFLTVQGRGKQRQKRYLCLFTCLTSRAVHLEMAYGLDVDSFLNAFYRFVNRRGLPALVVSDNGTNFVGAQRELKSLIEQLDQSKVIHSLANKGIKWLFNPPTGSHFGGVFEVMIKAAKRAIFAILSKGDITDEELSTAFTGAESLINSRPLTYQSAHQNDNVPLTPNHFLHGQLGGIFAPESVDSTDFHPRKRWRRVQDLVCQFWRRWMREWLPSLNARKKWQRPAKDLTVNDIVLVLSPETTRGSWQLGKIQTVYPGSDGQVRVVDVLVGHSTLKRPANKICPLEWAASDDDDDHPAS